MDSPAGLAALEVNGVPLDALHPGAAVERNLEERDGVQPVPALKAAIPAMSSAEESNPNILKTALGLSANDLDPELTT